jgi:hypothetical protein
MNIDHVQYGNTGSGRAAGPSTSEINQTLESKERNFSDCILHLP